MSISAISGGAVSAWDHHKEHRASVSGSDNLNAQDPVAALVSSATPSPAEGAAANGGTGDFGQLLNDMQAFFSDYSSASGSSPASIANLGTAISAGGTLSATLMSDLGVIAKDLTGIINGQSPATTATAAASAVQTILPGVASDNSAAATGPASGGTERGMAGHPHHGRHGFQDVSSWPDLAMTQGTTVAPASGAEPDPLDPTTGALTGTVVQTAA